MRGSTAYSRVPPYTRGASHTHEHEPAHVPRLPMTAPSPCAKQTGLKKHAPPFLHRRATMFRLGYFVALLAPAAALSGETVVGLASTALRLSRRALQDLPSIPGMDMSGMLSIPPDTMLQGWQAMYCNSDQTKARPALRLSPLPLSHPRPRPTRPEPSPRVTSRRPRRASRISSNSSTAR